MDMIVGVGDMRVSDNPDVVLTTYSLGSCIGLCIYDPSARVGGLLHYMLPESSIDAAKARNAPFMFGDMGIPLLFKESYRLGAQKNRLRVSVVGGAEILDQKGFFNIGKRNYTLLRKLLWKNNVMIDFEDVGGNVNRTLKLEVGTGTTWLKTSGNGTRRIA
jgi:chemotaxis protein CheD